MDTVIEDNVNPIEKVERSSLIVATTIHDVKAVRYIWAITIEAITIEAITIYTTMNDVKAV